MGLIQFRSQSLGSSTRGSGFAVALLELAIQLLNARDQFGGPHLTDLLPEPTRRSPAVRAAQASAAAHAKYRRAPSPSKSMPVTPEEYAEFCAAYGTDVTSWPGYDTLRGIRELRMTAYAAQHAAANQEWRDQARYRVDCLRGRVARPWHWAGIM